MTAREPPKICLATATTERFMPGTLVRAREGVDVESARVLHYVKAVKPWSPDAMLRWAWDPGSTPAASAFRFWYDAWLDVLAQAHVRTGVLGQAGWTFANRAVPADDGASVTAGRDG